MGIARRMGKQTCDLSVIHVMLTYSTVSNILVISVRSSLSCQTKRRNISKSLLCFCRANTNVFMNRMWAGIESHMAIVCASLPALNHFSRQVLRSSHIGSSLKSWTQKRSEHSSASRSKGYNQTTSQTGSEPAYEFSHQTGAQKKLHITQDVKLEDFLDDKRFDLIREDDTEWTQGTISIDEEALEQSNRSRTWLEDDASGYGSHSHEEDSSWAWRRHP